MNSNDLKQILGIYERYILEKQENKLLRSQIKVMEVQLVRLRKENARLKKKGLVKRVLDKLLQTLK